MIVPKDMCYSYVKFYCAVRSARFMRFLKQVSCVSHLKLHEGVIKGHKALQIKILINLVPLLVHFKRSPIATGA